MQCARPLSNDKRPPSRWPILPTIAVLMAIAGCGSGQPAEVASVALPAKSATPLPPPTPLDQEHPVVEIQTNQGSITIRLDAVHAPATVRNFLNYANGGFYDNTLVHYVDPGKIIAAGGYSVDKTLKPPRLAIRNEAHNGLKNVRGTIAMARDQALIDSATSQFYINLADAPQRDFTGDTAKQYGYCVFGEVIQGLEVAQQISQSPTANLGGDMIQTPDPAVVVNSIRVVR
jgi:peptidyl-prolyl cis-trans isomerase A (cyclophilin A)